MNTLNNTLAITLISCLSASPALAQFIYPPASFFSPNPSLFRGVNPTSIEWLERNDAQVFGFLLSTGNFDDQLKNNENPLTILAPTDEAFAELPTEIRNKLSDPLQMQKLLKYHLIPKIVSETDIKQGNVTTLAGSPLKIRGKMLSDRSTEIQLNDAIASESVGVDKNTIVIMLDRVLLPPDIELEN